MAVTRDSPSAHSPDMWQGSQRQTCGFISGNPGLPITCFEGAQCGLFPDHKLVACCGEAEIEHCNVSTRCFDSTDATLARSSRDMICADERAPYCKTDVMAGNTEIEGYSLFICDTDKVPETIRISTTAMTAITHDWAPAATSTGHPVTGSQSTRPGELTTTAPSAGSSSATAGTIAGAVAGSVGVYRSDVPGRPVNQPPYQTDPLRLGGLVILVVGSMLVRDIIKRKGQSSMGEGVGRSRHKARGAGPPREVRPIGLPTEPVELPDSPSALGELSGIPRSPGSTVQPLSPVKIDQDDHR